MRVRAMVAAIACAATACSSELPEPQIAVPLAEQMSEPAPIEMVNSDEGAVRFVEYFVDLTNWSYATGNDDELQTYCYVKPIVCRSIADTTDYIHYNEYDQYGGRSEVDVDQATVERPSDNRADVTVPVRGDALEIRLGDTVLDTADAFELDITYQLEFIDGGWMLLDAAAQ